MKDAVVGGWVRKDGAASRWVEKKSTSARRYPKLTAAPVWLRSRRFSTWFPWGYCLWHSSTMSLACASSPEPASYRVRSSSQALPSDAGHQAFPWLSSNPGYPPLPIPVSPQPPLEGEGRCLVPIGDPARLDRAVWGGTGHGSSCCLEVPACKRICLDGLVDVIVFAQGSNLLQ